MSYNEARELFDENAQPARILSNDQLIQNLNTGLSRLTSALQEDLAEIRTLLDQILSTPQR